MTRKKITTKKVTKSRQTPATRQKKVKLKPKTKKQSEALRKMRANTVVFLLGPAGTGKTYLAIMHAIERLLRKDFEKIILTRPVIEAGESLGHLPGPQPLDAKVLTSEGWKNMGDLKQNDEVISRDGQSSKILKIYPKGKKDVYKITTTDNQKTECCIDHLWKTKTKNEKSYSIKSTKEILNSNEEHMLPDIEPVVYSNKKLLIPPFEYAQMIENKKYIPKKYKESSIIDRISLLYGLMLSQNLGDVKNFNNGKKMIYKANNKDLAKSIMDVVRSLGGKTNIEELNINPFYKKEIYIESIEKVSEKKVQCILIDNPEHIYITNDFIPTHNTYEEKIQPYMNPIFQNIRDFFGKENTEKKLEENILEIVPLAYMRGRNFNKAFIILDEAQNATYDQVKMILTRLGEESVLVIDGDPDQSDIKRKNKILEISEKLCEIEGIEQVLFEEEDIVRNDLIKSILKKLKEMNKDIKNG